MQDLIAGRTDFFCEALPTALSQIQSGTVRAVALLARDGAKGYRIKKTEDLVPTIKKALADNTVVIIDCPVDYRENMKLTARLKALAAGNAPVPEKII